MRYLKRYENHEDIHAICRKYGISNYTINSDVFIDVDDSVYLSGKNLKKLPLKFRNVGGDFHCYNNRLTNLEGCPKSVGGSFNCYGNRLTSLEGCPKSVSEGFHCHNNRLTSLEGCPKSVGGSFNCGFNKIETFEGLDFINIGGNFYCDENPIYGIWRLFKDHTKFEFFNDCDIIREDRVIILDRLNFFLDYIGSKTVTELKDYKCI